MVELRATVYPYVYVQASSLAAQQPAEPPYKLGCRAYDTETH